MRAFVASMVMACAASMSAQTTALPLDLSGAETQAAVIRNAQTGQVVYDYNGNKRMTPASLTKLVTTAAALTHLGATDRYRTTANYDAPTHTLYICGEGDPTFNSRYFKWHTVQGFALGIADSLKQKGITRLSNVVAVDDNEPSPSLPSARLWEDMGNYYGAVPRAINYADNSFALTLASPAEVGQTCKVLGTDPDIGVDIECYVRSAAIKGDSAYIYGTEGGRWYVSGAIPMGKASFVVRGALPEPYKPFVGEVIKTLRAKGIHVDGEGTRGTLPRRTEIIATAESPTTEAICRETNKHSINLFADALLLRLGGEQLSWDNAPRRLRSFYQSTTHTEALFNDGSGLSPFNAITARGLTDILLTMHRSDVGEKYKRTLSVAGQDGTLRLLGKNTPIEGRVWGKSGSMTGVLGYAGYALGRDGQTYVFCIIVNHHTESNAQVRREITRWLMQHIKF